MSHTQKKALYCTRFLDSFEQHRPKRTRGKRKRKRKRTKNKTNTKKEKKNTKQNKEKKNPATQRNTKKRCQITRIYADRESEEGSRTRNCKS
jgi:hypothetical protein